MALKLNERYPQRWDSPSNDYPQGAFKNLTELGEQDGSYLEQDWLNDYSGFFGALLRNAEMSPDGTIDTAQRSQFYDALVKVAKESVDTSNLVSKDDITNELGTSTSLVATQKLVNDTKINLDNSLSAVDVKADTAQSTANTAVTKADNAQSTANTALSEVRALDFLSHKERAGYQKLPSGLILQWTESKAIKPGASGAFKFPIQFPDRCLFAIATAVGYSGNNNSGNVVAGNFSDTAVELHNWGVIEAPCRILAIGY